jgi:hypothetical protein
VSLAKTGGPSVKSEAKVITTDATRGWVSLSLFYQAVRTALSSFSTSKCESPRIFVTCRQTGEIYMFFVGRDGLGDARWGRL